jgi:protease IV
MLKSLAKFIRGVNPLYLIRRAFFALGNWRRGRSKKLDYILITLPASMPALPEKQTLLQRYVLQNKPPISLIDFDGMMRQISHDPRPKGVIFTLRGFAMSLADVQTLRISILRLRDAGKQIIFYAQEYDNARYFVASVGDKILLQPGGELNTLGLREQAVFLRDALDSIGVTLDSVAITPYKGAFDRFTRDSISPEGQAQLEWLMDSRYDIILQGIAEGRKLPVEDVRRMIDTAPHLDRDALAVGYVDEVLNEEALPEYLKNLVGTSPALSQTKNDKKHQDDKIHIRTWREASKMLLKQWRKSSDRYIALLPVSGLMMQGESGQPPGGIPLPIPFIGGERAGDLTVVRQVRNLLNNEQVAAVILYIDSGGGSAAAAEAMTSALDQLAKRRPIVAYMNGIAASGGYYIATASQWIVAQPGTITGSIGVITGKPITNGVFEKLRANRLEFTRGANANLYSDATPFTDNQRQRVRKSIEHIYAQFIERVARSRNLSLEAVDAVGGGRVWTGAQAKENGLVDELGDLNVALKKARQLAGLPDDAPMIVVEEKAKPLPPQALDELKPAAGLVYLYENFRAIAGGAAQLLLPLEWR